MVEKFIELRFFMARVEYLAIIQKAKTFCDSDAAFNNLLQVDSSIVIKNGIICFENNFSCNYKLVSGDIAGRDQRFFHMHFDLNSEIEENLVGFTKFLRTIKIILSTINAQIATLWDDISFHYSKISYVVIYEIENLMRKLISNFMLTKIGVQWIDEAAPQEIKDIIGKAKRADKIDVLHNVDFIDLANFLLKPYTNTSVDELHKKIRDSVVLDDFQLLESLLPKSNWNRYFSSLVSCDDIFLKKIWNELYELRCMVAHNSIIGKAQYDNIVKLSGQLTDKLEDALKKLPQVKVSEAEAKEIASNVFESAVQGTFLPRWRRIEAAVRNAVHVCRLESHDFLKNCEALHALGIFSEVDLNMVNEAIFLRHAVLPYNSAESNSVLENRLTYILNQLYAVLKSSQKLQSIRDENFVQYSMAEYELSLLPIDDE